jgi:uncharacterized protein YjdB
MRTSPFLMLTATLVASLLGASACEPVGVAEPITEVEISLSESTLELAPGAVARLEATVRTNGGQIVHTRPTWTSSDPRIAVVDDRGTVTALEPGEATISASVEKTKGNAKVSVGPVKTGSISLSPGSGTLTSLGDTLHIRATVFTDAGREQKGAKVAWSSLEETVATVQEDGVVVSRGSGTVRIVASSGGVSDTAVVAVQQVVAGVSVSPGTVAMDAGKTVQLSGQAVDARGAQVQGASLTWTTSASSVATVNGSGRVSAAASGSAVIRATSGSHSGAATVEVRSSGPAPVAVVSINPTSATLKEGETLDLSVLLKDSNGNTLTGRTITWSSSNTGVATVSSSGRVSAVKAGSATITATSEGRSGTAGVGVQAAGPTSPSMLAQHNFNDGTLGPYSTGSPGTVTVINDPTGAGRGKVVSLRYQHDGTGSPDSNRQFLYVNTQHGGSGIGFGQSIFFKGDLYVPKPAANVEKSMRKLLYWQKPAQSTTGFSVLKTAGTSVELEFYNDSRFRILKNFAQIQWDRWHTIEKEMTVNSSPTASDGVIRIWLDGVLVLEETGLRLIGTTGNREYFDRFLVGQQMQNSTPYDELRYWDRAAFATQRVGF